MHRLFDVVLCVLLVAIPAGIGRGEEAERKRLVCSTTQTADFARQIVGDRWQVDCVLAPGQDPHLYQTKPSDVRMVEAADLCVCNGWHLEGGDWMHKLATDAGKPLVIGVEGIKPLLLEADGHEINDPHAWFTPQNASVYVRNVLRGVSQIDPENKGEYELRAELYLRQLATLHAWIQKQVNSIPTPQRILVTSHDAFGYFCQAYGFRSAAPAGWSTGEEVGGGLSPARRQRTIDSIRQFQVRAIFVETSVNKKLISEIAKEADVEIGGELYSDSMGKAGSAGETYIGMMRENVLKIVQGLNKN